MSKLDCPKCGNNISMFRVRGRMQCTACGASLIANSTLVMFVILVLWLFATPFIVLVVSAMGSERYELFLFMSIDLILGLVIFYTVILKSNLLNIRELKN